MIIIVIFMHDLAQLNWVFLIILRFAETQKERVEKGEINPATLRNYIKAIKLFCEINDIAISQL
jgi:hypothetical protein